MFTSCGRIVQCVAVDGICSSEFHVDRCSRGYSVGAVVPASSLILTTTEVEVLIGVKASYVHVKSSEFGSKHGPGVWLEIFKHFAHFATNQNSDVVEYRIRKKQKKKKKKKTETISRKLCSGSSAAEQEACALLS